MIHSMELLLSGYGTDGQILVSSGGRFKLGGDVAMGGGNITDLGDVTFKTGASGGTLRTGTSAADKFVLQAYDVNDTTYRTVIQLDAGNDVVLQIIGDYLAIEDASDTTKHVEWDISGATASTATTLTFEQTVARTITFPDKTGVVVVDRQHKNAIINGCFRVRQRGGAGFNAGTTPANDDDTWLTDRWLLLSDGDDVVDITPELSDVPDGAYNAEEFTINTGNTKFGYAQILEHRDTARLFDGGNGTVSVSFDMKAPATITDARVVVLAWSSTADTVTSDLVSAWNAGGSNPTWATNWTAENTPANLNPTTSWARYKVEGIALDTASTANLAVFIWNNDTTTTATQQLRIANVQLERGSKATEFEFRHVSEELAMCQRYCYAFTGDTILVNAFKVGSGTIRGIMRLPEMRTTPSFSHSITGYGSGSTQITAFNFDANAAFVITGSLTVVFDNATKRTGQLRLNASTSFDGTNGDTGWIQLGSSVTAFLDAEL